ncbi:unnamed protein product, partial [Ostreobium quekettii]
VLATFDTNIGESDIGNAAAIIYTDLEDPQDFWTKVVGNSRIPPLVVESLMARLGDYAYFDVENPTGSYGLDLSKPHEHNIALRLRDAVLGMTGCPTRGVKTVTWRNVTIDGKPIGEAALEDLGRYRLQRQGDLQLDLVHTEEE